MQYIIINAINIKCKRVNPNLLIFIAATQIASRFFLITWNTKCFSRLRKILTKRQRSYPYQSDLRASDTQTTDQLASAIFDSGSKSSYEKDVGTNCANIDICPDFLIGALFAAGAAAFYVLYAAITKAGRRKKRKAEQYPLLTQVQDILYQGISPS